MPSTPISVQGETIAAGAELTRSFEASSRFAAFQVSVVDGGNDAIDVYLEGRLASFMPWSNVDEPDGTSGDPKDIRGIPPWVNLSPGDARGPTDVDVPAVPEVRVRVENTGGSEATVDVVARSY